MSDDAASAKVKPEHPMTRMKRELLEKDAAIDSYKSENERLRGLMATTANPAVVSTNTETLGASPPDGDGEMTFVDQVLAAVAANLEFKGIQTDIVKKVYTAMDHVLKVRRVVRAQVVKAGPGVPLPSFGSLGLNPSTGLPEVKRAQPAPAPAPAPAVPRRSNANDPLAGMAASIKAAISGSMAERAEKQPVAAAS